MTAAEHIDAVGAVAVLGDGPWGNGWHPQHIVLSRPDVTVHALQAAQAAGALQCIRVNGVLEDMPWWRVAPAVPPASTGVDDGHVDAAKLAYIQSRANHGKASRTAVLELCATLRTAWEDLERARGLACGLEQHAAAQAVVIADLQAALAEHEGREGVVDGVRWPS